MEYNLCAVALHTRMRMALYEPDSAGWFVARPLPDEATINGWANEVEDMEERIRALENDRDMLMEELPDSIGVRARVAANLKSLGG